MQKIHRLSAKKEKGISIIELLCVISLLTVLMHIVTPLLRTAIGQLPAREQVESQRNAVISLIQDLRDYIESADSVIVAEESIRMISGEKNYELQSNDKYLSLFSIGNDNSSTRVFERETGRIHVDFYPVEVSDGQCKAVNIRVSDIVSLKPELELEKPLNIVIFARGLNYEKK